MWGFVLFECVECVNVVLVLSWICQNVEDSDAGAIGHERIYWVRFGVIGILLNIINITYQQQII